MGKTQPEERWKQLVFERLTAFKCSDDFKTIRKKGLRSIGRRKLFTVDEWIYSFRERTSNPEFMEWVEECDCVGSKYGLATCTIEMVCLVKGYKPEKQPFVIEKDWPMIRIITDSTDMLFVEWLAYCTQRHGVYLIVKQGDFESTHLYMHGQLQPPQEQLTEDHRPPSSTAFIVRVETPPSYPPEAAAELHRKAAQLERIFREELGYPVAKRQRASSLISQAAKLKAGKKGPLPRNAIYGMVDGSYKDENMSNDQQRRSTIKSRRHAVNKRLDKYRQKEE